jgi:hypothetical protein
VTPSAQMSIALVMRGRRTASDGWGDGVWWPDEPGPEPAAAAANGWAVAEEELCGRDEEPRCESDGRPPLPLPPLLDVKRRAKKDVPDVPAAAAAARSKLASSPAGGLPSGVVAIGVVSPP